MLSLLSSEKRLEDGHVETGCRSKQPAVTPQTKKGPAIVPQRSYGGGKRERNTFGYAPVGASGIKARKVLPLFLEMSSDLGASGFCPEVAGGSSFLPVRRVVFHRGRGLVFEKDSLGKKKKNQG